MGFLSSLRRDIKGGTKAYKDFNNQRNQWVEQQLAASGLDIPQVQPGIDGAASSIELTPEQQARLLQFPGGAGSDHGDGGFAINHDYVALQRQFEQEQWAKVAAAEEKANELRAQWLDTLDPATKTQALNEFKLHSSDMESINKYGSAATKALLGTIAGGAALTAAGVIGGAAPSAASGAGSAATAGTSAATLPAFDTGVGGLFGSQAAIDSSLAAGATGLGSTAGVGGGALLGSGGIAAPSLAGATGATSAAGAGSSLLDQIGKAGSAATSAIDATSKAGSLWSSLGALGTTAAGLWNSYNSAQEVKDMLNASAEARKGSMTVAGKQLALADQNMLKQLALFDEVKPLLQQQIQRATEGSALSTQRSNDLWAEYKTTWEPLGKTLAQKSLDWASPARMEQEAARAAGDTKSQYDDAMAESRRSLEMSGAGQEKIAALEADARLKAAKAIGGASSAARRETESKGMTYLDNATRLGLNIPQLGNQTAQLGLSQAQQAQSGIGALTAATSLPYSSTAQLLQGANQSYGTASGQALAGGALTLNNEAQKNAGYGDALQAGAKIIGLFGNQP